MFLYKTLNINIQKLKPNDFAEYNNEKLVCKLINLSMIQANFLSMLKLI